MMNGLRKEYRPIRLERIETKTPLGTTGHKDLRLFRGINKLYAFRLKSNGLWRVRHDCGIVPKYLRDQVFTSTNALMHTVKSYYASRNVIATLA